MITHAKNNKAGTQRKVNSYLLNIYCVARLIQKPGIGYVSRMSEVKERLGIRPPGLLRLAGSLLGQCDLLEQKLSRSSSYPLTFLQN